MTVNEIRIKKEKYLLIIMNKHAISSLSLFPLKGDKSFIFHVLVVYFLTFKLKKKTISRYKNKAKTKYIN
jgi:hypothetical protein